MLSRTSLSVLATILTRVNLNCNLHHHTTVLFLYFLFLDPGESGNPRGISTKFFPSCSQLTFDSFFSASAPPRGSGSGLVSREDVSCPVCCIIIKLLSELYQWKKNTVVGEQCWWSINQMRQKSYAAVWNWEERCGTATGDESWIMRGGWELR